MPDSAGFFGTEDADLPKVDRYKRYVLDPHGKGEKSYTRSTTLAKTLEDTYMLSKWQQRNAARGVALRPDLVARAIVTPVDKKGDWEEILSQAETVAAGGSKANLGTAFHQLHDGIETMTDAEYLAVPENLRVTYERYRAELDRLGITELVSEVTVINEQIGTAGKVDGLLRLADGRVVVGDRKSGKASKYPHSVAIQLANYSHANLIEVDGKFVPMAEAYPDLDPSVGIVIEVSFGDADTATVHVYEFDLEAGWYGALLAAKVKRWRNRKDIHLPYHPEFMPEPEWVDVGASQEMTGTIMIAPTPDADQQVVVLNPGPNQVAMRMDSKLVNPAPALIPAVKAVVTNADGHKWGFTADRVSHGDHVGLAENLSNTTGCTAEKDCSCGEPDCAGEYADEPDVSGAGVPFPDTTKSHFTSAELSTFDADKDALLAAYKTKAALQSVLRKLNGPNANVARTRANLAADAVSSVNWPQYREEILAGETDIKLPDAAPIVVAAELNDTSVPDLTSGIAVPAAISDADRAEVAQRLASSNPFAQPAPVDPPHAPKTHDEILIDMVVAAESDEDLGGVWEYAQKHGMAWTPRVHQAGVLRQAALNS